MEYLNKSKTWFRREWKLLLISFFFGLAITASKTYALRTQEDLADSVLRFHVLANSDAAEDQQRKLMLRDGLLLELSPILSQMENREEAERWVLTHQDDIQIMAEDILRQAGCDMTVTVALEDVSFPIKTYGSLTFPCGTYRALRVLIGEGKGQNWWCVLYPPLCFVDEAIAENEDALKEAVPAEAYNIVTGKTPVAKAKFKVVELWQEQLAK